MNEDIFHLGLKALIKNKEGKILVLKGNATKKTSGQVYWDLPGGRAHRDEKIEEALRREVKEEIGISNFKIIKLLDASISKLRISKGDFGLILFTYLCTINESQKIKLTDDEHIDFGWFDPKEAAQLLSDKFSDSLIEVVAKL